MLDGRMGMQLSASLREESDPPSSVTVMITPEFQSTLPRRERLRSAPHALHGFNFNPRSREGSDGYVLRILHSSGISIHAPAKGATLSARRYSMTDEFQSTLPRRERPG